MTTDDHRDWRLLLGAYALGDLSADERASVAAHIEGCPECRAELHELEGVAALLPLADPARIEQREPEEIIAFIAQELNKLAQELVDRGEMYEPAFTENDERILETYKDAATLIRARAESLRG